MYEPDSMAIALIKKWSSWNSGALLSKGQNQEQKYFIALNLERTFDRLLQECEGNRAIFIPRFEQELERMAQAGEI